LRCEHPTCCRSDDQDVVDEAMSLTHETAEDVSFEALRLAVVYLVRPHRDRLSVAAA